MKKSDIDRLLSYRWAKEKAEKFISDIETINGGKVCELSLSKGRCSLTRFFMRIARITSGNKIIKDKRWKIEDTQTSFRIFDIDEHMNFFDHVDRFNLNGFPFMITSQPYQIDVECKIKMKELCDLFGLELFVGERGSALRRCGGHLIVISRTPYTVPEQS